MGDTHIDSDQVRAARHLERKNEDEDWEEIDPPQRRLAAVFSVRFSPEELEHLRVAAAGSGLSQFVRESALREAIRMTAQAPRIEWHAARAANSSSTSLLEIQVTQLSGPHALGDVTEVWSPNKLMQVG